MNREIHILSIEDVPADTELINHELRNAGLMFRTKRVETKQAFLHELAHDPPDVILSDHGLPSFDGFTALAIAREKCPEVPFIFVTSSLGEEKVIELFESGAAHCVLKNRLSKLPPVVHRALCEAEERRSQKRAGAERERIRLELDETTAQVTALARLLPICAQCKKIRDSTDRWEPLELYFQKHFNMQFTHGICPECMPIFLPDRLGSK
jgi:CheY-like chemotaxis protein